MRLLSRLVRLAAGESRLRIPESCLRGWIRFAVRERLLEWKRNLAILLNSPEASARKVYGIHIAQAGTALTSSSRAFQQSLKGRNSGRAIHLPSNSLHGDPAATTDRSGAMFRHAPRIELYSSESKESV